MTETQYLFGTKSSATPGCELIIYSHNVEFRQRGDTSTVSYAAEFDRMTDFNMVVGVSVNTDNTIRIWSGRTKYDEGTLTYDTTTASAGMLAKLMAAGNGSGMVVNGTKLYNGIFLQKFIGNEEFLTLANRMRAAKNYPSTTGFGDAVVLCGQSNARQFGYRGASVAATTIAPFLPTKNVSYLNGATGASALLKINTTGSNYWVDPPTGTTGAAWDAFYRVLDGLYGSPLGYQWGQGEADSPDIGSDIAKRAEYKAGLLYVFNLMRSTFGIAPVFIQPIGRDPSTVSKPGYQAIREVQKELAAENSWIHVLPENFTEGDDGALHLDDQGYINYAPKVGRKIAKVLGGAVTGGVDGPAISSVSRSGTTVTVNITHDGATDFTPTTGIEGFVFLDNDTPISITSAVRTNANTITLTLASTPTGAQTLYYGYQGLYGVDHTKLVKDNAADPMPLRSAKFTIT